MSECVQLALWVVLIIFRCTPVMIKILIWIFVICNIDARPFIANLGFDNSSSIDEPQCNDCAYDEDSSPVVKYTAEPSDTNNATYGYATVTRNSKNTTKARNNATITKLIDLLRVFRVVQLRQLQRYLSESLVNAQYESSRDDTDTAGRFQSEHRELSTLRNKSVVAIEQIFKEIVANKSIQQLWCDKQRDMKGANCSLAQLWKLFNMTLSETPRHKTNYVTKSGDFSGKAAFLKATKNQDPPTTSPNETMSGNITVELTVRMDGQKIGNVEMEKSYYEKIKSNISSLLPKPYKVVIHNDLTDASVKADSTSGEYSVENDAVHENSTALEYRSSESVSNTTSEKLEPEKEWSDTNIDGHNTSSNAILDELLELDPSLLSQNLFDEEASGGYDIDALRDNASNTTLNSTTLVLLPEPKKSKTVDLLLGPPPSNHSPNSSHLFNDKEDGTELSPIHLNETEYNSSLSSSFNDSKVKSMPSYKILEKILQVRDSSSELFTRTSRPLAGDDQSDFVAILSQLFKLLLSNRTLQIVQQTSSILGDGNLRNRYYTDTMDLLKLLKQTLSELEAPHDGGTEHLLIKTLKKLVRMLSFIDSSLLSLSQTRAKERTFSNHSLKTDPSFSKILSYQDLLRSRQSSQDGQQNVMEYGDLGDVKNSTEKHGENIALSVDELKRLLPLL